MPTSTPDRLTPEQQQLVQQNLGLVGYVLQRHTPCGPHPHRDRERDDLFQAGCTGLIRAAQTWHAASPVSFVKHALPRIRSAIWQCACEGFSLLRIPLRTRQRMNSSGSTTPPARYPFDETLVDPRPPADPPDAANREHETVSQRVREIYVSSVRQAAGQAIQAKPASRHQSADIDLIVEERLLVPNEESRASLRELTRRARSSYARIACCEKRLTDLVRTRLAGDEELALLLETAKRSPAGWDTVIDRELADQLESLRLTSFFKNVDALPQQKQTVVLAEVLEKCQTTPKHAMSWALRRLDPQQRLDVLRSVGKLAA